MSNQELITIEQDRFLPALSMQQAIQRRDALVAFVKQIMVPGVDYGRIPGTDKDTLHKPGAERLCSFFGLTPDFQVVKEVEGWNADEPLFYYRYKCRLLRDGRVIGDGEGSCNSRESKYRWRNADRLCPNCEKPAIKRSKFPPKNNRDADPGWYCYSRAGGCGAEFAADDQAITSQQTGRMANPDICDLVNTIQKMAQKRAFVAATLIAVNASEYFSQDLEDLPQPAVQEASYTAPTLDTLRTELKHARERLRTLGGEPRPLSKQQAEGMDGAALASEILETNNKAWEMAITEIATARSEAQTRAQQDMDELFPDKLPVPRNGKAMKKEALPL